jgi:hypothetical protein
MLFSLSLLLFFWMPCVQSSTAQGDREKAAARQQFVKDFRDVQLNGQGLLRDHEAGKLNPKRLSKLARSINKSAKSLRSLIGLGNLAKEVGINKDLDSQPEFDDAIHKLAKLISVFAHNPVHQNSKILDTDQAAQAQTDLLTIINLSKAIADNASGYSSVVHWLNRKD